ncbi:MAG: PEP-CTERM sorting domain-containing protein, partial [Acidobacteriaceae bacterium]
EEKIKQTIRRRCCCIRGNYFQVFDCTSLRFVTCFPAFVKYRYFARTGGFDYMSKRFGRGFLGAAIAMIVMLSAGSAMAGTLYTTLGPGGAFDSANGYFVDGSNFFNQVIASPFMVSSTATLTGAQLGIGNFAGSNSPINLFVETGSGGSGGVPDGNILATLTQVGTIPPFGSMSLTQFTCSGCLTLTTGTQYWLVAMEADPTTEQAWNFAFGDAQNNIAFDQNGSATGPFNPFFGTDVAFEIDGSNAPPIPEPGSLVLFGSGMLGLAGVARRRFNF